MSDTIQGARTRNYIKENVPGIQNSNDTLEYATVQEAPGKRGALDAVIHGSFTVSTGHIIEAGSVKRLIKSTAHGAQKGWIMRPSSGLSKGEEIAIVKIVDANFFVISEEFDLAITDTFSICRLITPNYTEDGDLNVVVTASGPVQFIKDTVITTVEEDTVVPANNEALPTKMFIEIDGLTYPVKKDTVFPSNTVSVPVEVTGASGPINITAGDLNVQLSDQGPNADVTRIGNGTNQWGINASNEGLIHDTDVKAELVTLNLVDFATEATSASTLSAIGLLAKLTDTQPVSIASTVGLTDTELRATPVPVSSNALTDAELRASAVAVTSNAGTDLNTSALNLEVTQLLIKSNTDKLDVLLSTRATEATLLAQSAKLPPTLGTKTSADSLSVTMASNQGAIEVSQPGKTKVAQLFNDYTLTSVTTGAYIQLTASTASSVNTVEIFDSSGQALILAVGAASLEVDQLYIFPGGNGKIDLAIPASSRISIKAKTATANVGFIAINLYS